MAFRWVRSAARARLQPPRWASALLLGSGLLLAGSQAFAQALIGEGTGLTGDYCNRGGGDYTQPCTSNPDVTRTDATVDFTSGDAGWPAAGIGNDTFSVRWTGQIQPQFTQNYRIHTITDDGIRVWVDGDLVIDNYTDHAATEDISAEIALTAGEKYDIVIEYYENGGAETMRLLWSSPSTAPQNNPVVVPETQLYRIALLADYRLEALSWDGTPGEVEDSSVHGLNGLAMDDVQTDGTTPAIAGDPGTCRYGDFDNVDGYLEVAGLSDILNGTASLSFWIKTTQTGNDTGWQAPGVTGVELGGGADDIFWGWIDASGRIGVSTGNDYTSKSATTINDGAWRHVVLSRDASNGAYQIYIDGNLDAGGTIAAGTIGTAYSSIGRIEDTGGTPEYFNGQLDEIRIYNQPLTSNEVAAVRASTHPCQPEDLLLEYRMDEPEWTGAAGEVTDTSGNGLHGQTFGAQTERVTPARPGNPGTCGYGVFDGNSRIQHPNNPLINNAASFSVAMWVRMDAANQPAGSQTLLAYGGSATTANGRFELRRAASGNLELITRRAGGQPASRSQVLSVSGAGVFDGNWHHVVASYDEDETEQHIYVDGVLVEDLPTGNPSALQGVTGALAIGTLPNGANGIVGEIDEVRLYDFVVGEEHVSSAFNAVRTCPSFVSEYEISHSGSGISCLAENIAIRALDISGNPVDAGTATIDLSTSTTLGTWSNIVTGGGGLASGGSGTGTASYTFPGGESEVILAFNYTEIASDPEPVELDVTDGTATGTSDPLSFSLAGFRFVDITAGSATIPGQIAGKPSNVAPRAATLGLQAVRASDDDPSACEAAFPDGETISVELGAECDDPAVCGGNSLAVSNGGSTTSILTSDDDANPGAADYTPVPLTFGTDATATLVLEYADVGRTQLHARYDIPLDNGTASGNYMLGSSNGFIWRPFGFAVEAPDYAGATGPAGSVLARAGEDFPVNVTAVVWQAVDDDDDNDGLPDADADLADNAATVSFGQEATAEGVTLSSAVAAPAGGADGLLTGTAFSGFSNGTRQQDISWSEVGYVHLDAALTSGNYLGEAGNATGRAAAIGRFIPDHFTLSAGGLVNRSALGCSPAATFTYIGEEFSTDFVLTSRNTGGNTTLNYTDDYARLAAIGQLGMGAVDGTTDLTAALEGLSASLPWEDGSVVAQVLLRLQRNGLEGPYGDFEVGARPDDADGVMLATYDLDISNNGTDDHALIDGTVQRFGRLVPGNAIGSELASLDMPLRAEYWDGEVWRTHTDDVCTELPLATELQLSNDDDGPVSGDQPIVIGAGQTQVQSGNPTLDQGTAEITFAAPEEDGTGWLQVQLLTGPDWGYLRDDLDNDGSYDDNPLARVTFGLFPGNPRRIYQQELIQQ